MRLEIDQLQLILINKKLVVSLSLTVAVKTLHFGLRFEAKGKPFILSTLISRKENVRNLQLHWFD